MKRTIQWVRQSLGKKKRKKTTRMGFEPTRAEHNGLAVHRLNHSATSSAHSKEAQKAFLNRDTLTSKTPFAIEVSIFSSIIAITIPLSSKPLLPARPLIWMYSPEVIYVNRNILMCYHRKQNLCH